MLARLSLLSTATLMTAVTAEERGLRAPPGFAIETFASGLGAVRAMVFDPRGTLLVSVPREGRVLALPDPHHRGRAAAVVTVASELDLPYGLAFRRDGLYIAETGRVRRFRYDATSGRATDPVVVVAEVPREGHHWSRSIAFGPDGKLYLAIGSSCDICEEHDRRRAAIVRYNPDGTGEQLFATGLRNVVGLAFHRQTQALWATVNERDWRAGGAPPDYVTEVREGAFFGWPRCFAQHGRFRPDPELPGPKPCSSATPPTLELDAHSAPLGLAFYFADRFPNSYRGDLFVAAHGSRPGLPAAGYTILRVKFGEGRAVGVEDFVTGWRRGADVLGRPADVAVGLDGALYISDDYSGRVHRVSYRSPQS